MKKLFIILLIIAIVVAARMTLKQKDEPQVLVVATPAAVQCFEREVEATPDAPYEVHERIELSINGAQVQGTKSGTQSGPDMTNGYQGTLSGTKEGNMLSLLFSYTIEGSQQSEQELYRLSDDALTKLRYPLIESNGVLVPGKTKGYTEQFYIPTSC